MSIPHGSESGYLNHGCRCDQCRQAHASYQRELVSRKRRNRALTAALEAGA